MGDLNDLLKWAADLEKQIKEKVSYFFFDIEFDSMTLGAYLDCFLFVTFNFVANAITSVKKSNTEVSSNTVLRKLSGEKIHAYPIPH